MKTPGQIGSHFGWIIVALLAVLAAGCENTVDPFIETDRYFTIFGYLDTASDTQFVRVIPFRRDIGGSGDPNLDATVTSTELESGTLLPWRDSVITYADGSIGHVF